MPTLYMQCPCGEAIAQSRWNHGKRVCVSCGIAKGVRNSLEIQQKQGPAYEHWRDRMLKLLLDNNSDHGGKDNGNPG